MHEFPTTGPIDADVRAWSGRCEISAEDTDTLTVDVAPIDPKDDRQVQAAKDTVVEFDGAHLLVKPPEMSGVGWLFGGRRSRLRISVRMPSDSKISVKTAAAELTCTGRLGAVSVTSAGGGVYVEQVAGDVSANSASGDIQFGHITGNLNAKAASGDLEVGYLGGNLTHHSASGDTVLGETRGQVRIRLASGDVRIARAVGGPVRCTTASGNLRVGVPAGTGVWLDLNTSSGTVESDLSVGTEPPLSGHELELRLYTASGDIEVHRTAALVD